MSTKRTHKPALVAKPKEPSTPAPEIGVMTKRQPLPANQLQAKALTDTQALLVDEIAEMLIYGADYDDLYSLLWGALGHMNRKKWSKFESDAGKVKEYVETHTEVLVSKITSKLAEDRRRNARAAHAEQVEPNTVTTRLRQDLIGTMRNAFETFVIDGTPEEHYILCDMFTTHESNTHGRLSDGELPLLMAMAAMIEQVRHEFTRIPERFVDRVEKYIECLKAAEMKAA